MIEKLAKIFACVCVAIVVMCFMTIVVTFTIDSVKIITAWW